jgi:hypothetical protein
MMYKNQFVAAIKSNGKIVREFGDIVYLPFKSEYEIYLKNLNVTSRALVNIFIDGNNITEGGLVIRPGQDISLERSLSNNNLTKGNKFLFIERSRAVENHRGINAEDGLIRVEFALEIPTPRPQPFVSYQGYRKIYPDVIWMDQDQERFYSVGVSKGLLRDQSFTTASAGITAPGSESNQAFSYTSSFNTGPKESIIFKLLGGSDEPITVDKKNKCKFCGTINPMLSKYCMECGSSLTIF